MSNLKSIAVVGASGNLGQAVIPFLKRANFDVTAICRSDSTASIAESINVIKTEYTLGPLTEALKGHDVVLCVLDPQALAAEAVVIDAASNAGVKWFIPSEFGHNTADERVLSSLPFLKGKSEVVAKLESKTVSGMNWVGIITGFFFDWCLSRNFLEFDIKERSATIWDDGNTKFHATNIGDIGAAIVNLLSEPNTLEKVKNTYVYISSFELTQNKILLELERATGTSYQVKRVKSEDIQRSAMECLAKGDVSAVLPLLQYIAWGNKGLGHFNKLSEDGNALLLPSPQETFESTIERVVEVAKHGYKVAL